jgi:hypothetical protein
MEGECRILLKIESNKKMNWNACLNLKELQHEQKDDKMPRLKKGNDADDRRIRANDLAFGDIQGRLEGQTHKGQDNDSLRIGEWNRENPVMSTNAFHVHVLAPRHNM